MAYLASYSGKDSATNHVKTLRTTGSDIKPVKLTLHVSEYILNILV